jgi:peptidase M28-like protein
VLDHRVYRAAFLPALVAIFVLAFSLSDIPRAQTTRLAPLAFDAQRAFAMTRDLAERFPDRRPGSTDDEALADFVAERFDRTAFAGADGIERRGFRGATIDGDTELETVVATREGLSNHSLLVIAHRDAPGVGAAAELSGTATLLELARLFADRDLAKTVVLASVSGGSGGYAGATEAARAAPGPVDAVLVLGDLASANRRRPLVVPWGTGSDPAPLSLERTVQSALRAEAGTDPGQPGALAQLIRRAVPLTLSEQGAVNREGLPAVLLSASSERRPDAQAPVVPGRMDAYGRATLRTLYAALDAKGDDPFPVSDGVLAFKRLVPTWSIRLVVLALLLPALMTAFDAFFRARRRGAPMATWTLWAASLALPVLLAWLWARALGLTGAVTTVPAPSAGELELGGAGWAAAASAVLVAAVAAFFVARRAPRGPQLAAGGPAAAAGLLLSVLVLGVWLFNAYAAAVLLPAAHVWLLTTTSDRRLGRGAGAVAVAAGLALPLLVVAYYVHTWRLAPGDGLATVFNLVAGGTLGLDAGLAVAAFSAVLWATVAILRARRALARSEPDADDPLVTRGPRTYAGPGSLGGTESALRR